MSLQRFLGLQGFEAGVQGLGFRGLGFKVFGFRVWGLRFRVLRKGTLQRNKAGAVGLQSVARGGCSLVAAQMMLELAQELTPCSILDTWASLLNFQRKVTQNRLR